MVFIYLLFPFPSFYPQTDGNQQRPNTNENQPRGETKGTLKKLRCNVKIQPRKALNCDLTCDVETMLILRFKAASKDAKRFKRR